MIHLCDTSVISITDIELEIHKMLESSLGPQMNIELVIHRVPQGYPLGFVLIIKYSSLALLICNRYIEYTRAFLVSMDKLLL